MEEMCEVMAVQACVGGDAAAAVKVASDSGRFADIFAAASSNANTNVSGMGGDVQALCAGCRDFGR